jgi:cardiolipin synthase
MKTPRWVKSPQWFKKIQKYPLWRGHSEAEWACMAIAVITVFYVFINLFTALADNTPPPSLSHTVSLTNPAQFENVIASSIGSTVESGSPITILTNGKEFLPDLLNEIKNAKQTINVTDYIWDDGEFGNTILQALAEKAKSGVQVRLLLDGWVGKNASKKYIQELTDAGGAVGYFRPASWSNVTRLDRRTHVRDFVIDGKISYIGGMAISDGWLGDATSSTQWHDFMFKSGGAMAARNNIVFGNMWSQTTGESIVASSTQQANNNSPHDSQFVSLFSAPSPDLSSNMDHFMWLSIMAAQKSIHITNPYLMPSPDIEQALEEKARAGIDVEIVVPGVNTDAQYTRWASQSYYDPLLAAGIKIYEYQPSRIHAKTMVIDGVWSIIGSANLDNRSSEINLELIAGVYDPAFGTDVESKFLIDRQKSQEITSATWGKSSSALMAPVRMISRLFVHQF